LFVVTSVYTADQIRYDETEISCSRKPTRQQACLLQKKTIAHSIF